jgi:hypothetical protein
MRAILLATTIAASALFLGGCASGNLAGSSLLPSATSAYHVSHISHNSVRGGVLIATVHLSSPTSVGGGPPPNPTSVGGGPPPNPTSVGGGPPPNPTSVGGGPPPNPTSVGGGPPPNPT